MLSFDISSPRFKGHSYIGFTVNPKRRIRQHNGEITSGAFRTKKKRPWEMVLCIHGFPTNVAALQFEWAWQHPRESIAVREAAASFKTLGGLANKIKLALTMLTLHSWQSMNLTVSFFSTKYMKHAAGCPTLPQQMKLHFCSMDELPCYWNNDHIHGCDDEDDFHSNDSEASANVSDERLESLTDDSMEMNLSSINGQSCNIQEPSNDLLARDRIGVGGTLEGELSLMMGTLEKHMQSPHQLPADVSGSTRRTSNELLQPCEEDGGGSSLSTSHELLQPCEKLWTEDVGGSTLSTSNELLRPYEGFWTEEVGGSFPDAEEHMQSISGIDASEDEMFPVLDEQQPSCQLPADVPASAGNELNEFLRFGKENGTGELRGSFPLIEDHLQPCQQAGPLDRQESSMDGLVSSVEDVANRDEITCIVIDDVTEEQHQPTRLQSSFRRGNTFQPSSSEGIEIIEICTPSPDLRINRVSKKKRANSGFPDIIDLTRSPSFVQL
ncbi:Structure-specific endonuclease subunit SLX1 [Bienertia sinuspersici]